MLFICPLRSPFRLRRKGLLRGGGQTTPRSPCLFPTHPACLSARRASPAFLARSPGFRPGPRPVSPPDIFGKFLFGAPGEIG